MVCLLILLAIVFIASAFAVFYTVEIENSVKMMECATGSLANMVLNGATNLKQTTFFTGIRTIE